MADQNPPPSKGSAVVAWVLLACGGIVTLTCGGCTLVFSISGVSAALHGDGSMLALALLLGGVPTFAGVVTMAAGWNILRRTRF